MVQAAELAVGAKVRVKIPLWLAQAKGLRFTEVEGEVVALTAKALRVRGHAAVTPSSTCRRCGREITNPVSVLIGFGPYCSEEMGIPRDWAEAEVDRIREMLKQVTQVEEWFPRSRATVEVLEAAQAAAGEAGEAEAGNGGVEVFGEAHYDPDGLRPMMVMAGVRQKNQPPAVRLQVVDGRIRVRSPYRYKDALKGLPGARWNATERAWEVPAGPDMARRLQALFRSEVVDADQEFGRLAQAAVAIERAGQYKEADGDELPDIPCTKTRAWGHQKKAYWFALNLPAALLHMEMGTGKSKVTVDLIVNRGHQTTLILAPRSVVAVWPREFRRHAGKDVDVLPLAEGSVEQKARKAKQFLDVARAKGRPAVVVVNYESAWREPFRSFALGRRWDCVVLDESHRIKAPGGKASRFCAELGRKADWRLALTGTPMPHSPLDIYAQFRFLAPDIFGTSFARFRTRYAVMGGYGGYQVVGYKNMNELHEKMAPITFQATKDVLDLPPVHHVERVVRLGEKAMKVYNDLDRHMYAAVKAGEVTAANALVRLLRLQQVTSGFLPVADPDSGGTVVERVDDAKREALQDILEDVGPGEPVVVFCRFQHDLDVVREVAEVLGRRYGELSGRRNDLAPDATMPEWAQVFGVQIQAGGVGIDLTRARYAVYYSLGFSLGDYEQSLARVHRPGQTRTTTYFHLIAEGTVDRKVYRALRDRKDVVEAVLAGYYGGDVDDPEE